MVRNGTWMKPNPDQETIIALKAQIFSEKKGGPKKTGERPNGTWCGTFANCITLY
jgi:hypothetical protein